jgi:hypothetical protein
MYEFREAFFLQTDRVVGKNPAENPAATRR